MAKRKGMWFDADLSDAIRLTETVGSLDRQLNTDRHLNAVTAAGFSILRDAFNQDMHMAAQTAEGNLRYHHVYEWEHVGEPGFQLWNMTMGGRGGQRTLSWTWRPSKTTVPTTTNINGTNKFVPTEGFDPKKLNRIHVFVWKAPIMEYGVSVVVRPRLSHVLVYPNNAQQGEGTRAGRPVFTPHLQKLTPGARVQGNFTAFFLGFFSVRAGDVLDAGLSQKRNNEFRKSFSARVRQGGKTRKGTKSFSFVPNAQAAREGENIARAIAGDTERAYYNIARRRKKVSGEDE